jgi:hypothetical protein
MEVAPPALNNTPKHVRAGAATAEADAGWFGNLEWINHLDAFHSLVTLLASSLAAALPRLSCTPKM